MLFNFFLQITQEPAGEIIRQADLSMFQILWNGAYVFVPIIFLSLFSVYLIIKKTIEIRRETNYNEVLWTGFKEKLRTGNVDMAKTSIQTDNTSFGRIFTACTKSIGEPIRDVESTIEMASGVELSKLGLHLNYLGLVAGIAPMLGFIGTISGVIKIFYSISVSDNISIGIIAGGLYEKMISSGAGLVVGVVAYMGYHLLMMQIEKFTHRVECDAFDFMTIIKGRGE